MRHTLIDPIRLFRLLDDKFSTGSTQVFSISESTELGKLH